MSDQCFQWPEISSQQTTSKFLGSETHLSEHTENLFYAFIIISDDSCLIEVILKDIKEVPSSTVRQSTEMSNIRVNS